MGELSNIPEDAICPISQAIMRDPVICADGHSYDRETLSDGFLWGIGRVPRRMQS